jgi:type I restriction enzyme S subunit
VAGAKAVVKGKVLTNTLVLAKLPPEKEVQKVSVKSLWLIMGEMRLDASFYAQDVSKAMRLLEESGYDIAPLYDEFATDVFYLPREKRFFADSHVGKPYLMPSELFYFPHLPSKFVYAQKLNKAEDWFVKEGWILLTRSGRLGELTLATEILQNFVVSDDVIRIVPKEGTLTGYVYAYLSTWVGKALLTKDQYGVTVEHIEPHHVRSVKMLRLPKEIQKIIHRNIGRVFGLRDKARLLLAQSQRKLLEELELPNLEKIMGNTFFPIASEDMKMRFDASYHDPIVGYIEDKLKQCKCDLKRLRDNMGEIFIPGRFKRIYVDPQHGIPLLSGKQVAQIKPYDLKYISTKVTRNIEDWMVKAGWVLVTCSGTIGRIALVPKEWDGWTVSQHALRIVPNKDVVSNGFLAAFLLSEYGQQQILAKTYGGVVDELAEEDMRDILVPLPTRDVQENIGKLVVEAYQLRETANEIENDTVRTLETMLEEHRKVEVNKQYLKEVNSYADSFELIGNTEFRESCEDLERGKTISLREFKKEHGF